MAATGDEAMNLFLVGLAHAVCTQLDPLEDRARFLNGISEGVRGAAEATGLESPILEESQGFLLALVSLIEAYHHLATKNQRDPPDPDEEDS